MVRSPSPSLWCYGREDRECRGREKRGVWIDGGGACGFLRMSQSLRPGMSRLLAYNEFKRKEE